jgi:hypothetical protein
MSSSTAVAILLELATNEELFFYPKSRASDLKTVLREIGPMFQYEGEISARDVPDPRAAHGYMVSVNGRDAIVLENESEVWVNFTDVGEGSGGSALYAAVADYAHNSGRVFIGDPEGLSDIALRRRTENMLSSALKHGTTRHMAPHPRQIEGDAKLGVPPLHWNEGSYVGNIRSLIENSIESMAHHVPEIRNGTYDFGTGTFRTGEGQPISDESFDAWATTRRGRAARAGSRTLKRGLLLNTLLHRAGEERPGLLAQILRRNGELVAGTQLAGVFY